MCVSGLSDLCRLYKEEGLSPKVSKDCIIHSCSSTLGDLERWNDESSRHTAIQMLSVSVLLKPLNHYHLRSCDNWGLMAHMLESQMFPYSNIYVETVKF